MLTFCLLHLLALPPDGSAGQAARDRTFWTAIVESKYEVPAGEDPFKLLTEMNGLIGSSDPVLRDGVAHTSAARWIFRKRLLRVDQQKILLETWLGNLTSGIGDRDTDTVFRRSFSALNLSILAALDNEASFLSQGEFDDFLTRTLGYLGQERDVRGYDAAKGWIHTPAHTADVLKFLARSPKLPRAAQAQILSALSAKCQSVEQTFAWGEDERLAQVVRSIVRRADFDAAGFQSWLGQFPDRHRQLWSSGAAIDKRMFPAVQNVKLALRAAFAALSADQEPSAAAEEARQQVLKTLAMMQ